MPLASRTEWTVFRRYLPALLLLTLAVLAKPVASFDDLTPAQKLIYDTDHFNGLLVDGTLSYHLTRTSAGTNPVEGEISAHVTPGEEDNRRDIEIEFLSGEDALQLPPFLGYRGNPVVIASLEYLARDLGQLTEGGTLYFRNRLRDALASSDTTVERGELETDASDTPSGTIVMHPLEADPYLGGNDVLQSIEVRLEFSQAIPGSLLRVSASSRRGASDDRYALNIESR